MSYEPTTPRRFLRDGAIVAGGASLALHSGCSLDGASGSRADRPARLVRDRGGVLDLPRGFQYRMISEDGSRLNRGFEVPGRFDGMGTVAGSGGGTVLIRNHELRVGHGPETPARRPYDRGRPGGTTAVVVGPDRRVVRERVTSSGTIANCAGGAMPWGTWLTCEEDLTDDHGYVFEVDPRDPEGELSRTPITAMGRFSHEAVARDPRTGVIYLTEDGSEGSDDAQDAGSSFLYRYVRFDRRRRPGALQRGGLLQALALEERPAPRPGALEARRRFGVQWRLVNPGFASEEAREKGCARFVRLEGCAFASGALWFSDTVGGEAGSGQMFRHRPRTETLELFHESSARSQLLQPDNVVVAPWGDVVVCSDSRSRLIGITPAGELYPIARSRLEEAEMCGPTFSADGRTLFVNTQEPSITYAIWGPFGRLGARGRGRRRAAETSMATAAPPAGEEPAISPELAEAAGRHGLTRLEAAAYDRLGVPL